MTMRKDSVIRIILMHILVLFLAAFLGTVLMTIAYKIPVVDEIEVTSKEFMELQGWNAQYPLLANTRQNFFKSFLPGVFDGGTMRVVLSITLAQEPSSALEKAMVPSYVRYWHGYVSLLRPLFYFLDYEKIEVLNGFLQFILMVYTAVLVGTKFSRRYLWVFLTSAIMIFYPIVAVCFQFTWVCWIGYAITAIYLSHTKYFEKTERLMILFLISGILTSYLDFLTYPLFTWGMPIVWVILHKKGNTWFDQVKNVIFTAISWVVGYGGMWASKWLIASVVLKVNALREAMNQAAIHTGVEIDGSLYRWIAISRCWRHYQYFFYAIILFVWLVVWIALWQWRGWKKDSRIPALFIVACSSLVWCSVLYYHVFLHHFFAYRIDSVAIVAWTGIVIVSTERKQGDLDSHNKKVILLRLLSLVGVIILAVGLERVSFEETKFTNWDKEGFNGEREEMPAKVTMEFYPENTYINNFYFVVFLDDLETDGILTVSLRDEGQGLLYQNSVNLREGNTIYEMDVDWKLSAGQRYLIEVSVEDCEKEVFYLLSDEGQIPVSGIYYIDENGHRTNTQPLLGITYFERAQSRNARLFYIFTWIGVGVTILSVLNNIPYKTWREKNF